MIVSYTLSMESKICPNCGNTFRRKPSELKRCKFCSVSCRMQSIRERRKTVCKICGKEFYPEKRKNRKNTQFCSRKCMGESYATLDDKVSHLYSTLDFIDGFMLSDGHISDKYCHISWSLKHPEFSNYIKDNLSVYKPQDSRRFQKAARCRHGGHYTTRGNTKCHPDLTLQRERWYKNKKSVPIDIIISPSSLMIWYLGDGVLTDYGATLCTDNFSETDVDCLIGKLIEAGIECKKRFSQNKPRIAITSAGRKAFFDYIGWKSPVKCYEYKFPSSDTYIVTEAIPQAIEI